MQDGSSLRINPAGVDRTVDDIFWRNIGGVGRMSGVNRWRVTLPLLVVVGQESNTSFASGGMDTS